MIIWRSLIHDLIQCNALIIAQKYDDEERPSVAADHLMLTTQNNDNILMIVWCYDEMLPIWWWRVCACHWQLGPVRASWRSAECSRKCCRPDSTASARPSTSTSTSPPRTPGLLSPKVHLRSHQPPLLCFGRHFHFLSSWSLKLHWNLHSFYIELLMLNFKFSLFSDFLTVNLSDICKFC